jgi:hypothetical protein
MLNLLTRILEFEFGESPLQHFGLFDVEEAVGEVPAEELHDAQLRFASHLKGYVEEQAATAVILLVGDTLLPLAASLAESGRVVHWLGSPSLLPAEHTLHYAGENFVATNSPDSVDLLIHAGSLRYMDQMAILSKSRDMLRETGKLVLFSEFLHDDSKIQYSLLPNISSFEQLSRRLGFEQRVSMDLSSSASRSLELLCPLLEKHAAALLDESRVDDVGLRALRTEFAAVQDEYATGRRGFNLFVLEHNPNPTGEWVSAEFGDINSFQSAEISDLFESSFNVDFNQALWNWKYVEGDGKCVVARLNKQGEVVAHYGGAPRKIIYFGEPSMAIQPCDVMVHPSIRKQYGKGSLFFEVAATFLEREIGNTVSHLLGFGFPNQKTMNISKRLGLYEKTDDFLEIVYPPSSAGENLQEYELIDYDPTDAAAQEQLNTLWEAMQNDYREGVIGLRDADYIQYRYVDHPFASIKLYRCLMIRVPDSEQMLAFAVLKEHEGGKLLMDLVCAAAHMKTAISILKQEFSDDEVGARLRLWVTSSGKDKVYIEGAIVNELGIEIPCNSWNPGPSAELLYGAWWLTAGDMDFV